MAQHDALGFARATAGKNHPRLLVVAVTREPEQPGRPLIRQHPGRDKPRQQSARPAQSHHLCLQIKRAFRPGKIRQLILHRVRGDDGVNLTDTKAGLQRRASCGEVEVYRNLSGANQREINNSRARSRRQHDADPARGYRAPQMARESGRGGEQIRRPYGAPSRRAIHILQSGGTPR